jgi:hypothetical protein
LEKIVFLKVRKYTKSENVEKYVEGNSSYSPKVGTSRFPSFVVSTTSDIGLFFDPVTTKASIQEWKCIRKTATTALNELEE